MARPFLTGVLLVGGSSRRFGGPKALARLGAETLAERAWRTLGEACDERLAVGKASDGLALPFPLLDDGRPERHPAAGLVAALRAAKNDVCSFLPVDCPAVRPATLRALGRACADAAIPSPDVPLPGAYRKTALPVLERCLTSRGSLRAALVELDAVAVAVDQWELANVNTPADLEAAERRERAIAAAVATAAVHGLEPGEPRIVQDWNDTIVHLAPHPVVARIATSWVASDKESAYRRELAVAAHAAAHGGPVARPSGLLPAGPHRADDLVLAFWELLEREPGEIEPREAGQSLRRLHRSLAGYPRPLPALDERLDRAGAIVEHGLARLDPADRALLARTFRELRGQLRERALGDRVLHGGAHDSNVIRTPAGLRWIDLDTVCRGPLEWDLAHLPEQAAAAFPEHDPEALALTRRLVGADVAIWCWHTYGRAPAVDEAAHYHLERVREVGL